MATNVILIFVIVVGVILVGTGLYVYLRNRSMEEIRADVYHLFLVAEHTFTESGSGKQKMEWVISKARGLLPGWLQTFVTDEVILRIIQGWFTAVKDLLDDGRAVFIKRQFGIIKIQSATPPYPATLYKNLPEMVSTPSPVTLILLSP